MTGTSAAEELTYRRVTGEQEQEMITVGPAPDGDRAPDYLTAARVRLPDGTELRQFKVAPGLGPGRAIGYGRLDGEILAGRRLHEVTWATGAYPPVLARLYGDESESADPCALLEPYTGQPLAEVAGQLVDDEQRAFDLSLLAALCWLEVAGLAHRGLSPWTVRWDGRKRQAQVTDFSLCTVFGVPREVIGTPDWAAPEQRDSDKVDGLVSERDDMHAAGRLIYYVHSQGDTLRSRDQLDPVGLGYLDPLIGPPHSRPTARQLLLEVLKAADPVPRGIGRHSPLKDGHDRFDQLRRAKRSGM